MEMENPYFWKHPYVLIYNYPEGSPSRPKEHTILLIFLPKRSMTFLGTWFISSKTPLKGLFFQWSTWLTISIFATIHPGTEPPTHRVVWMYGIFLHLVEFYLYVNNTSEMDPKGFEISQFSVKPEKRRKTGQCPASVNHPPVLRQRLHLQIWWRRKTHKTCVVVCFFSRSFEGKNRDRCSFLVHFKSLNISITYPIWCFGHTSVSNKISKMGSSSPMFWAKKQAPAHLQESKC